MSREAIVREFNSEVEASLAVAVLRANGIDAVTRPADLAVRTSLARQTAVIVRAEEVARATALLDSPARK